MAALVGGTVDSHNKPIAPEKIAMLSGESGASRKTLMTTARAKEMKTSRVFLAILWSIDCSRLGPRPPANPGSRKPQASGTINSAARPSAANDRIGGARLRHADHHAS